MRVGAVALLALMTGVACIDDEVALPPQFPHAILSPAASPTVAVPRSDRLPWEVAPRTRADMPRGIELTSGPQFYSRRDFLPMHDPVNVPPGAPVAFGWCESRFSAELCAPFPAVADDAVW